MGGRRVLRGGMPDLQGRSDFMMADEYWKMVKTVLLMVVIRP
jgi:hypothetical protein